MSIVIDFNEVESWPSDLLSYLDIHHAVFLGWATGQNRPTSRTYDRAVYGLDAVLQPYALTGWHCTRLTNGEVSEITTNGMGLPSAEKLAERIDALVSQGLMTASVANSLKAKNQAHEPNRAGRVWFCFFPPHLGAKVGSAAFFVSGAARPCTTRTTGTRRFRRPSKRSELLPLLKPKCRLPHWALTADCPSK
jgi:hypothetical protein